MSVTPYLSTLSVAFLSGCFSPSLPSGPYLVYAQGAQGSACPNALTRTEPGITFNNPTNYQNSSGGAFSLVQLISTDTVNGDTVIAGLDTQYPYKGPPSEDNPALYLPSTVNSVTREFTANMFLMWTSTLSGSIPVPLGYQTWGFVATATCNANCDTTGNWTSTTSSAGPVGGFETSSPTQTSVGNNVLVDGFPTWTGSTN